MTSPSPDPEFFDRLAAVITRRYQANAGLSLREVHDLSPAFLDTQSDEDFAFENREKILAVLTDPAKFDAMLDLMVTLTIEFTYASNQFIQLDTREQAEFRRIYAGYLLDIQRMLQRNETAPALAAGLRELVAGHFTELRANIARFFDPEAARDVHANVILQRVVCADYTPELQLDLFGLRLADFLPPVLDLGCGKSGHLVRCLNRHGIQAVGIDRLIDPVPGLVAADWLSFPLQPGAWGTVVSHMAFSHHFIFHHRYRHGAVEPYARQYMAVLKSLQPGGSFYYAPGLPFIELYLPPETYTVTRRPIPSQPGLYAARILQRASG